MTLASIAALAFFLITLAVGDDDELKRYAAAIIGNIWLATAMILGKLEEGKGGK